MTTVADEATMENSPLINLALLETLRARRSGYFLDHFVTFLAYLLANDAQGQLSPEEVQDLFRKELDIFIPLSSVMLILNRAAKKGLITRADGKISRVLSKVQKESSKFTVQKSSVVTAQKTFFDSFISFVKDKHGVDLRYDAAEHLLSDYLKRYQIDLIDQIQKGAASQVVGRSIKNPDYLISSFINHIYQHDQITFRQFEITVRGYLVANHIVLKGTASEQNHLTGMVVALDTPLLMGLIGFNGKAKELALREMTELLRSLRARVVVFEHTFEEWEGIFHAWVGDLRSRNFRNFNTATLSLLQAKGYDDVAIEVLIPRLKNALSERDIEVVDKPTYVPEYTIDETGLKDFLVKNGISDFNQRIDRDVVSVSAIYRLRAGRSRVSLNEKPAVFVTSNISLVKLINRFFEKEISEKSVPLTVNDVWLTNLCWMMQPNLFPSLPRNLIVANCHGVIYADDKFWDDFLFRFRRMKKEGKVTDEDYRLVRYETDLKLALKDLTVTEGDEYSDESIYAIIKGTKEKLLANKDREIAELREQAERPKLVLNATATRIAVSISWGVLGTVTAVLLSINYYLWKMPNSVMLFALGSIVFVGSTWFDISLIKRRRMLEVWLRVRTRQILEQLFFGGHHETSTAADRR